MHLIKKYERDWTYLISLLVVLFITSARTRKKKILKMHQTEKYERN